VQPRTGMHILSADRAERRGTRDKLAVPQEQPRTTTMGEKMSGGARDPQERALSTVACRQLWYSPAYTPSARSSSW
jgi:hypothetical protein